MRDRPSEQAQREGAVSIERERGGGGTREGKKKESECLSARDMSERWMSFPELGRPSYPSLQSLKELGDVENWAKIIETDMKTVATTLEYVHAKVGDVKVCFGQLIVLINNLCFRVCLRRKRASRLWDQK